jgi:hypothetical protein
MRRFTFTISVFFAIFAVLYTGFWIYQSQKVKTFSEEYVRYLTKKFGGDKSEFVFADSKRGGFPFSFKTEIVKPKFIINESEVGLEISSENSLVFKSNIFGTRFGISLPQEASIAKANMAQEDKTAWMLKCTTAPVITMGAKQKGLLPWVLKGGLVNSEDLPLVLTRFNYTDQGCKVLRTVDGIEVASLASGNLDIHMGNNIEGNYNLIANFKNVRIDKILVLPEYISGLGTLDIVADISYEQEGREGVEGASTKIRQLNMTADNFSLDVRGNIDNSKADALPFGGLQIKLTQYENFVDYNKALINYVVANSAFPIFSIKDKQTSTFKEFLKSIASEKTNDDKDILVLFNRKEGEDFRIGELGFYDALQMFKSDIKESSAPQKPKNTAPVMIPHPYEPEAPVAE